MWTGSSKQSNVDDNNVTEHEEKLGIAGMGLGDRQKNA
jgi:hypothetical protein